MWDIRDGGQPMTQPVSARDRIKQEMLRQLGEAGYGSITITGLAESLGMSRQNLYKHYSSKEEIFHDITQDHLEAFFDIFEQFYSDQSSEKWQAVILSLLGVIEANRGLIRHILQEETERAVFASLKSAVSRALGHVARVNELTIRDLAFFDILSLHITGSSYHVTKSWILDGEGVSAKKMALILGDLFNDGIVLKLRQCAQAPEA